MKRTLIAAAMAAQLSGPAGATQHDFTGNDLHYWCEQSEAFCFGLATGVLYGVVAGRLYVCPATDNVPSGYRTFSQIKDVIAKFLRDHPERRHEPAIVVIGAAVHELWPCPR